MKFEEMIEQATLYKEMLGVLNKRPQMIAESKEKIQTLKKEIEELESGNSQELLSKLNPKKFFFKKTEVVDVAELILKKEIAIRQEEKVIEELENAKLTQLVDLEEVTEEASGIINENSKVLNDLEAKIIQAREVYHVLLDEYTKEYSELKSFRGTIDKKVNSIKKADYVPRYNGDTGYESQGSKVAELPYPTEIIDGHRDKAINILSVGQHISFR